MRCASCATELIPGKRFCHACGAPAAGSCPSCGAAIEPGYRFCPDCGHTLAAPQRSPEAAEVRPDPGPPARGRNETLASGEAESPPRVATVVGAVEVAVHSSGDAQRLERLRRQFPESLAEKLRAMSGAAGGERKRVTVLFCDIAGSTEIADRLDPEEYRDVLEQYVELCLEEIYRFEGIVNQLAGDGMMALFGAPIAHEDAPERAIRAALAIRSRLVRFNDTVLADRDFELHARFGINTGPVTVASCIARACSRRPSSASARA